MGKLQETLFIHVPILNLPRTIQNSFYLLRKLFF